MDITGVISPGEMLWCAFKTEDLVRGLSLL